MRSFRLSAVGLVVLFASCADPPKKLKPGSGGASATGGSAQGGTNAGGMDQVGDGGGEVAGAAPDGSGGEGATPAVVGEGGQAGEHAAGGAVGEGGAAGEAPVGVDPCAGVVVGVSSSMPVPAMTTGVAKPAGAIGNLKVLNWAGYKGAISFTFDDALESQITHYDALNMVGVPMTFFLVGNNDGSKPIWTTAALDGHELGNHTMHHCTANGSGCGWGTFTDVDRELDDCTDHMKSAFGVEGVYSFASPMGDDNWVEHAAKRFLVGRGTWDDPSGVQPNVKRNEFSLPCHISAANETAEGGFNLVTDSVRAKGIWRIVLAHALSAKDGYNPIEASEMIAAMTYARDLGDVWIDTFGTIGAYWRAQIAVSSVTATDDGSSHTYAWQLPPNFPPGQFLRVTVDGGTPTQCGTELTWDDHGYYEIALDAGSVTLSP